MNPKADLRSFFEQELNSLLDRLYGAALRLTKDEADAEDLVAEAVAKALANLHTLKDKASFRSWMFRILMNTFISDYRKRAAQPEIEQLDEEKTDKSQPEFWLFEKLHQPFLLWWGTPEQEFLNGVLRADLEKAVDALPEVFRIVVVLVELEGFSYQEAAKTLRVPVGTVRSRLARGRSILQAALWQHATEAGLRPPKAEAPAKQHGVERKLAAVFYADVAGYSRLMGVDEAGTHHTLSAYLDLITAAIESHGGKVQHFAGDAVLADFRSALDSVTCAVGIQRDLEAYNGDVPDKRKLQFRIGINLGDVIVDRNDIYGDGVNVAARLEGLAEPGGICISGTIYDAIGNNLSLTCEFMGEQSVKNIANPIRAYRVLSENPGGSTKTNARQTNEK